MPAAKKRKVTVANPGISPSFVGAITAFTKVSKPQVTSKWPHQKSTCSIVTQLVDEGNSEERRKLFKVEDITIDNRDEHSTIPRSPTNQSQKVVKLLQRRRSKEHQRVPQTPKKPKWASSVPISADTPTKGAGAHCDKLASSPFTSRQSLQLSTRDLSNTVDTGQTVSFQNSIIENQFATTWETLPSELLDLINLHASFLTALSLHHAHNGAHNPADLRLLCPDVARAWGKRKVLVLDIQRIMGVLNHVAIDDGHTMGRPLGRLSLSNYGHGKICVEAENLIGRKEKIARPLDENRLNEMFTSNLQRMWDEHQCIEGASISKFVQDLPIETISVCPSLMKMSPLLAKGQQRLEDLKAGLVLNKQTEKKIGSTLQVLDEYKRNPSLLERLKAKELRQSTLPAPPSKAQLSRNAALHRLEEVVLVLSFLTTSTSVGQQRVSFTLQTILGKLKDSFKTPISKEESENCVRLLASDIAPEWLKIVRMGKVEAVIVHRDNRPSDLDIKERVQRAV